MATIAAGDHGLNELSLRCILDLSCECQPDCEAMLQRTPTEPHHTKHAAGRR